MTDIILESIRVVIVAIILIQLVFSRRAQRLTSIQGGRLIIAGFVLIFLGMVVDVTDNFESLN
ncbi:MAG: hypothetical protein ACYTGH_15795, partial [Planctomycetota bacterium]